jgi:hypothetical protein
MQLVGRMLKYPRMAKTRNIPEHRLYDPARGRFFVRNGEWTKDEAKASTFQDLVSVVQLCLRYGLADGQLLIHTGRGRGIRMPICQ